MPKLNKNIIWVIIIVGLILMGQQGTKESKKIAGETMNRQLSINTVQPGGTFTVKYNVLNYGSNPFFFSIKDTITGGCTVFGSSEIVTTLTSPQTSTSDISVVAPQSGSCTFTGDYKLGSNAPVVFPNAQVTIQSGCISDNDCNSYDGACVDGKCNTATGQCSTQNKANGVVCPGGTCSNGVCQLSTGMQRVLPSTASPSSTFSLKYVVNNPQPPFFFSIKDVITGGCTVSGSSDIVTTLTSPQTETGGITVNTPTSGSCQFNGDWKLGSYSEVNFPSQTLTIGGTSGCTSNSQCSSECKTGVCTSGTCTAANKADGTSCTGGTCQSGTCKTSQTCSQLSGTLCSTGQTCSGTMTTTTDGSCCVGGTCADAPPGETTCEEQKGCEFWEACNSEKTKCEIAPWVFMGGIFMGFLLVFNSIK